jgi:hypothetical protein
MSYYTLPKKPDIDIKIQPLFYQDADEKIQPYISQTLVTYITNSKKTIEQVIATQKSASGESLEQEITDDIIDELLSIANQYNYIHKIVPGTVLSVSKLKPESVDFYNMMEIINNLNVFEYFPRHDMTTIMIGKNVPSIKEYMDICREDYDDNNFIYNSFEDYDKDEVNVSIKSSGFLFYDISNEKSKYNTTNMLKILMHILDYQETNGVTILKINDIIYKPIIEFIYFLTSLFNKTIIYKPNTVCSTSNVRYLVCKGYMVHSQHNKQMDSYKHTLLSVIQSTEHIKSFITDVPYYFINKIEESNIILGHQTLESYDLIASLISSKNRTEKLETLSKANINKCIQWCEKYKIPYNKFTDKVNIFLAHNLHGIQHKNYQQIDIEYVENDKNEDNDDIVEDDEVDNSVEMNIETSSVNNELDDEMQDTFKMINEIIMDNLDDSEDMKKLESENREALHKIVSELMDNIINQVITKVETIKELAKDVALTNNTISISQSPRIKSSIMSEGSLYIHAVLKNLPPSFQQSDQVPKKSFSIKVTSDKC